MNNITPDHISNMDEHAKQAEALLKMMANRSRLMILCHLVQGEKTVGEINQSVPLSQPALSQHLAKMRQQGLVSDRKEGQLVYYKISSKEAEALIQTLYSLYCL